MQPVSHDPIIVVVSSLEPDADLRAYATMLTAHRPAQIRSINATHSDPFVTAWGYCENTNGNAFLGETIRKLNENDTVGLIVSEWLEDPEDMQEVLRQGHCLGVPVVVVRNPTPQPRNRIVVATAGGPNVMQMMWVAREVADALQIPVHLLRIQQADPNGHDNGSSELDACACRLLRMKANLEIYRSELVEDKIVENVAQDDMLVLGAPSALSITTAFTQSLPYKIARRLETPVMLLSMPPHEETNLRALLWGDLIQLNASFRNKQEALSCMIDNLVYHNHISLADRETMVERAAQREELMPTATDCETAFPHITISGLSGIGGCMAICPNGVDFGSQDGHLTRFIFLLVTPDRFYGEYLATVAKIARTMMRTETRFALLQCNTPEEVRNILTAQPAPPP